jgi:hypothetical protein
MCDQWDGAIENVKVWDRALSAVRIFRNYCRDGGLVRANAPQAEIEGEADFLHRPAPGGWGKPRYS